MTTAAKTDKPRVAIIYPETDNMAENTLQRWMTEFLWTLVKRFLSQVCDGSLAHDNTYRSLRASGPYFVSADQFWFYEKGDADKRVSPDVYVIAGVDPDKAVPSWQLWKLKTPPLFALEIVSENVNKDYVVSPSAYEHTKVQELVVFDPEAPKLIDASRGRSRVRWQIWRRDTKGAWLAPLQSNADRVYCEALCCWLRLVGEGDQRKIRIATGPAGEDIFATEAEFERAEKDRERAEKDRERALRIELEEKLKVLEKSQTKPKSKLRRGS